MKGIITNLKRMAVHDGHGLRTTVFFKGCPLRCIWCHNPDTLDRKLEIGFFPDRCIGCGACTEACSVGALTVHGFDREKCVGCGACTEVCPTNARVLYGREYESAELVKKILVDRDFFVSSGGGVTLSGGECLAQIDFAVEVASLLCKEGISVDIDTSGAVPFSVIERIIPYTDEFLYDIKAIDSDLHKRLTGRDNALVLENLKRLDLLGCKIEIRYPFVPGYNDGECERIAKFLKGLKNTKKIKVLGYHKFAVSKYSALGKECHSPDVNVTRDDVEGAVELLRSYGLDAINGMDGD